MEILTNITLPFSDPVLVFGLVMVLMMVAPILAEKLRVPGLVGLILAGAIVGESGLGFLTRDATFRLLGTVGLLYLMFIAGVTLDLAQFARLRTRALVFGSLSFALPAGMATLLGGPILGFTMQQSLLLAAIAGSHTLLAFPIAARLGIASNTAVVMAVGATMVTDVISLVVLAGVLASLDGDTGLLFWGTFALGGLVYALFMMVAVARVGRWFFRVVQDRPDTTFAFLMSCLFIGAWLAQAAQLAPLIGAFLAGLALNRLVPARSTLMTRLQFMGEALLIPFFLVSVGMLVDLRVLLNLEVWGYALLFSGFVVLGKGLAAHGTALMYRYERPDAWIVAGLTIPQAAATLAVTLEGFDRELFDSDHVNAVVLMILITCFVGPWLVDRYGRAAALATETAPRMEGDAPQRIMIPLANPNTVQALTDFALLLHAKGSNEPLYPLTIARRGSDGEADVAGAEKLLEQAVLYAAAADVTVSPLTRVDHNIAAGIHRAVEDQRISTIVIGWNGERSTRALVFGGVLDQLLEDTNEVLIVLRSGPAIQTIARILVAAPPFAEREPGFASTLDNLRHLAHQTGADVRLVATETTADAFQKLLRGGKPSVASQAIELDSWGNLPTTLDKHVKDGDLLLLWSSRKGSLSWRATLDRLPALLAARFDSINFATIYPSFPAVGRLSTSQSATSTDLAAAFRQAAIVPLDEGTEAGALIEEIADRMLADATPAARHQLRDELMHQDVNERPEFMPGGVLYTAHTELTHTTMLSIAWSPEPRSVNGMGRTIQLVVALAVPADRTTEQFLALVATTAHRVRVALSAESLAECTDEAELRRALYGETPTDDG